MVLLPLPPRAEGEYRALCAGHFLADTNVARQSSFQQCCGGDICCGAGSHNSRRLLLCCVRLSPEKEPERFVALVEQLQSRGALARLGLTPLLCASATSEAVAQGPHAGLCIGQLFFCRQPV